jgi:multidrug resistance efflux pump
MRDDTARRRLGRLLGIGIIAAATVAGLVVWAASYRHPRTDDAAVRANVVGIAPHVGGPIVELPIVDNQHVRAGDLLFAIDARPFEARLEQARAALALADAEIEAQRDGIAAAEADVTRAEADEAYASDYLRRLEPLLRPGFTTADRVQEARTRAHTTTADRERAHQERGRAQKLLAEVGDLNARRQAAQAAVKAADLDVGYCRVHAPFDAWVTNLNIAVGQYARQGDPVFALVDDRAWYVIANFRETFLEHVRPGMEAEVFLVSYPGRRFRGVVQGIGWAVWQKDGSTTDIGLPAVERSLDWVRLAQRFPVRIALDPPDPERPYRMGATAVVTIRGDAP